MSKNNNTCNCYNCQENNIRVGIKIFRTMPTCYICGNKRCPKATDHNLKCSGSNETGQEGSVYK
jgi:hypothetical protein